MQSNLYKITLNYYGELHILHSRATSSNRALSNAIVQLSKTLNKTNSSIRRYIKDGKDRWKVEEL